MDQRHFPAFYRKNVDRIYRFIYYRVGGNTELAQDLTQDVFLKAFEAFGRYDENVSVSSWIYTIARNHLINTHAKTRPTADLESIEETMPDDENWMTWSELKDDERRLIRTLTELPQEDANLIRRKYLEGWSFDELAEEWGKTSGALRVQSHRILKRLRSLMKQR
ncbi:MAG: sigma-70 family RNA polymerase sigma factor [Patescibacteria group bacterium]